MKHGSAAEKQLGLPFRETTVIAVMDGLRADAYGELFPQVALGAVR